MSFGFPSQPCSVIIGGLLDLSASFVIQRPVFGTLYNKAQAASNPKADLDAKGSSKITCVATSFLKSYAINSLLVLTGARDLKSAAVVGSLVLFAATGQQLIANIFVAKKSWDVILAQFIVRTVETVGLAVAITSVKERHGGSSVQL